MAEKPKPGSFAPYLDAIQKGLNKRADVNAAPVAPSPMTLLGILSRQVQQTLPIGDLQQLSGMDPSRYLEALKTLRDSGYITVDGPPLEEVVRLSDKGVEVARLARPS
jgi:hypothetical protein